MSRRKGVFAALVAAGVMAVSAFAITSVGQTTHSPANKVWVSASKIEWMHTQPGPATATETITENADQLVLAQGRGKFSNPQDLRISVTSECALWTNTATVGDDDAESKARVEIWITIDDKVVPVSLNEEGQPAPNPNPVLGSVDPDNQAPQQGRVVFCNRATRMKTEQIEGPFTPTPCGGESQPPCVGDSDTEDDILIRSYNRTRDANGFNWAAMDVGRVYDSPDNGKGIVDIEVHARLASSLRDQDPSDNQNGTSTDEEINSSDSPLAAAAVGKRTLFVEPVKMANDATF